MPLKGRLLQSSPYFGLFSINETREAHDLKCGKDSDLSLTSPRLGLKESVRFAHHLLCSDLAKSCLCFYLLSHHADGGALDTVHATQETFYWTAFQSYNPIFDDLSLRPLGRKQISTLNQKQEGARVSQDC